MIVNDNWWSNGSARSTIIAYHEPFDQGFTSGMHTLLAKKFGREKCPEVKPSKFFTVVNIRPFKKSSLFRH